MTSDDDKPRIDKATGEFERSGPCESCGKKMRQTKTIAAPSYELMMAGGDAWGKSPLFHGKCP